MTANRRFVLAAAALVLIPVMAACSPMRELSDNGPGETTPIAPAEEPTPTPEPTPSPVPTPEPEAALTADEVIENASERVEELESVRFELQSSGVVEIEGVGDVSLREAEGAIQLPDLAEVQIAIQAAGVAVPLTIMSIDGEVYYVDPFTDEWESAPSELTFDPADIFSAEYGVPALLSNISEVELVGTAEVDGRDAYHIIAVIDRETVDNVTNGIVPAEQDVEFDIWIDQETYDILWIELIDPTGESEAVWMMRIFDHNQPVEIEDPRQS